MAETNDKTQRIIGFFSNPELFSALGKDLKTLTGDAVELEENVNKGKLLDQARNPMAEMAKIGADLRTLIDQNGEKMRESSRNRSESLQQNIEHRSKRLESYAKRKRTVVAGKGDRFVVAGQVTDKASGNGIPNLIVKAIDMDRKHDDQLGTTRTDALGYYRIEYTEADFKEKDNKPETFIEVMDDNQQLLYRSKRSFIEKAGKTEKIDAEIDGSAVPDKLLLGKTVSQFVDQRLSTFENKQQNMNGRKVVAIEKIRLSPEIKRKPAEKVVILSRPSKPIPERMLRAPEPAISKDEAVKAPARKVAAGETKEKPTAKTPTRKTTASKAKAEIKKTTAKKTVRKTAKKTTTKKTKKK